MSQPSAPTDLDGKVVALIGRFGVLPRRVVVDELQRRGGTARRALTRRTDVMVIGARAGHRLAGGQLQEALASADRHGVACISESAFLRLLGLLPPAVPEPTTVSLEDLPDRVGLAPETVRLLVLFDLIEPEGGAIGFRDLVSAREIARLLREGVELADILDSIGRLDSRSEPTTRPLARHKLVSDREGHVMMRLGEALADLDGQMRLPLPETANPTADLLFEAAEEAEMRQEWRRAEALYRSCVAIERSDPIAPFNLANVLREQGRAGEAKCFLQRALAIDPGFAEAWYNLAGMVEAEGHPDLARLYLRRAVDADPFYGDPMYNLAHAHFKAGDYVEARKWWRSYLDLDPDSEWSRKAQHGLTLCQSYLQNAE